MKIEFRHSVNDAAVGFRHRIVAVETYPDGSVREIGGEWSSYRGIAQLDYHGQRLAAATAYYEDVFPVDRVFEMVAPRHAARFNQTELDAHQRVHDMALGCLAEATDEYLLALESKLHLLVSRVRRELDERVARATRSHEEG